MHRESLWLARPESLEGSFRRELVERGAHSVGMFYYHGVRMPFPSEVPHALHYRWLVERGGLVTHQKVTVTIHDTRSGDLSPDFPEFIYVCLLMFGHMSHFGNCI